MSKTSLIPYALMLAGCANPSGDEPLSARHGSQACSGADGPAGQVCEERIAYTRVCGSDLTTADLYLLDPALPDAPPQQPVRVPTDSSVPDGFPKLSPDGRKILFESTRLAQPGEPSNISDLFLIETSCIRDGNCEPPVHVLRGAGASWSPDSKKIAFHASATGSAVTINGDPGAPTIDSDIFVVNVDDLIAGVATPTNLTNTQGIIEDDPDWSNDGTQIVFTRHQNPSSNTNCHPPGSGGNCPYPDARVFIMNADGSSVNPLQTPDLGIEERAPAWSPVDQRILFLCRILEGTQTDFEVCVQNADGTGRVRLTNNAAQDLTAAWSPDGTHMAVQRSISTPGNNQIVIINASSLNDPGTSDPQLTTPTVPAIPSCNGRGFFPHWGYVRSVLL